MVLHLLHQLNAVHAGHFDVADDKVDFLVLQGVDSLLGILDDNHAREKLIQVNFEKFEQRVIVIDCKDIG
jgi:hypothetical protein